jgi:hypothetical protein
MKLNIWFCFGLICCIGFCASTSAQPVYSSNVVGYANITLHAGNDLISSPFGEGDNTLNTLFSTGLPGQYVPEGTTFTEWDPLAQQYLPLSTYTINSGWTINYTLSYGQGGLLNTPVSFTNVFAGEVWPGLNPFGTFVPPLVTNTGSLLLSCYVPYADASFYQVVGRDPLNGESATMLDASSQTYTTTTFQDDLWDNGAPSVGIGQAAFFNLLDPAPEPATGAVVGMGLLLLTTARWRSRRKSKQPPAA